MRLVENFYAYPWQGNDNNCSSYVFAEALDGKKHVIVDPGHFITPSYQEPGLERLLNGMEKDGLDSASVGLVVLTHSHPDHSEASMILRSEYQSMVAIHEADAPDYGAFGGKADIFLAEGTLELGTKKPIVLQIYHSPGHTPGHITIYWPDQKLLVAGDCIFYRSMGRSDLPGGDFLTLRQSIERLSELDIEYLMCGHSYGHPGIIRGREEVRENFQYIKNLLY